MELEVVSKKVVHEGKVIRVVESTMSDGRIFEKALRSPGTRVIVYDLEKDKCLLSKEYRDEIKDYDYRLPGGKVRDRLKDWDLIKDDPNLIGHIKEAAKKEAREESAIDPQEIELFTTSTSGGPTVEWTLFYLVTNKFSDLGKQSLEVGEKIDRLWVSSKEAIDICLSGKMREGRSSAALLQYFHSLNKI